MGLPKVLSIVGQTASGKTALSLALVARFPIEIISADSRQVYRGMDLGSGKATKEEQERVPHHMIDVVDPTTVYTVADFVQDGRHAIETILAHEHVPVVVGGTFLYVDALFGRVSLPEVPPNPELRHTLAEKSLDELYEELVRKDSRRAGNIDRMNRPRLIRALEIVAAIGSVPESTSDTLYDVHTIGLAIDQKTLHERIHTRLHARLDQGMIEEVERLHTEGVSWERLHAFGLEYRHIARFLQGKTASYDAMVTELERDIRAFAKRQMTWLKRDASIVWYPYDAHAEILVDVGAWLV